MDRVLGWLCECPYPERQQRLVVIHEIRAAVLGEDHRRVMAPASWSTIQSESTTSGPHGISCTVIPLALTLD